MVRRFDGSGGRRAYWEHRDAHPTAKFPYYMYIQEKNTNDENTTQNLTNSVHVPRTSQPKIARPRGGDKIFSELEKILNFPSGFHTELYQVSFLFPRSPRSSEKSVKEPRVLSRLRQPYHWSLQNERVDKREYCHLQHCIFHCNLFWWVFRIVL